MKRDKTRIPARHKTTLTIDETDIRKHFRIPDRAAIKVHYDEDNEDPGDIRLRLVAEWEDLK